jgi:drug/metabolite transporter (DMT)-like permease
MNAPFGLGLILARYVPATEFALIYSTSPLVNYVVALVTRRENATPRRLLAILLGFASTAILILTRQGTLSGEVSWWLVACLSMPLLYTAYNWFATLYWPANEHPFAAGVWESVWSGLLVVPLLLLVAPPWGAAMPEAAAYWTVVLAGLMWVVERISFFTLIREKGAVFTVQAVYLSTPAAVLFAVAFFGGSDIWLWISLAILMAALYLNNTGSAVRMPASAGS